jgi:hypothetical protein
MMKVELMFIKNKNNCYSSNIVTFVLTILYICFFVIIPLEASDNKKQNQVINKKDLSHDFDPQKTQLFVFYSMQAGSEYFAELTGQLDAIFKHAKHYNKRIAFFVEDQSDIKTKVYNKLLNRKKGFRHYFTKYGNTGFYTTQFYYLWNKLQNGYSAEVIRIMKSLFSEPAQNETEMNTQTIDIVEVCEKYARSHPNDYIIFIRSITDRGNLSYILRHNKRFIPRTYYTHAGYHDFAIPELYKAEHKQLLNITVLPEAIFAEASVQRLLKGVENALVEGKRNIESNYYIFFLFLIIFVIFILIRGQVTWQNFIPFVTAKENRIAHQSRLIILILFILLWGKKHNLESIRLSEAYTPREVWLKNQVSELLCAHNLGQVYTLYNKASQTQSHKAKYFEAVAIKHFHQFRKNLSKYKREYSPFIKGVLERGQNHKLRSKIITKLMGSKDEFINSTLRLIQRESSFSQQAISPKGAVGLMQLMPETERIVKKRLRKRDITAKTWPKAFQKPIFINLVVGSEYYSWLNSIFYIATIIRKSELSISDLSYSELVSSLTYERISLKVIDRLVNTIELSPYEKRHVFRMALAGFNAGEQNNWLKHGKLPRNDETTLYVKYIDEVYRLWMDNEEAGINALVVLLKAEEEKEFKHTLDNARQALFKFMEQYGTAGDTLLAQLWDQDTSDLFYNDYQIYKNEYMQHPTIASSKQDIEDGIEMVSIQ